MNITDEIRLLIVKEALKQFHISWLAGHQNFNNLHEDDIIKFRLEIDEELERLNKE